MILNEQSLIQLSGNTSDFSLTFTKIYGNVSFLFVFSSSGKQQIEIHSDSEAQGLSFQYYFLRLQDQLYVLFRDAKISKEQKKIVIIQYQDNNYFQKDFKLMSDYFCFEKYFSIKFSDLDIVT